VSSVVAGKPVNIAWYQPQPPTVSSSSSSSSSVAVMHTTVSNAQLTATSKDVSVELNTDVIGNNDDEDDVVVVDPVQRTSQVG